MRTRPARARSGVEREPPGGTPNATPNPVGKRADVKILEFTQIDTKIREFCLKAIKRELNELKTCKTKFKKNKNRMLLWQKQQKINKSDLKLNDLQSIYLSKVYI